MKAPRAHVVVLGLLSSILSPVVGLYQPSNAQIDKSQSEIRRGAATSAITLCTVCIRAHVEFLASDALRGRGSGTGDELIAATYAASELRAYGIEPADADGSYLQRANLLRYKFTAAPQLKIAGSASTPAVSFTYGPDFQVIQLTQPSFSGPLLKVNADEEPFEIKSGAVVLVTGRDKRQMRQKALSLAGQGAAGAMAAFPEEPEHFEGVGKELPNLPPQLEHTTGGDLDGSVNVLELSAEAARLLQQMPDGTMLHFQGAAAAEAGHTWNAVGILRGSDPKLRESAVLLSAHIDHLGVGAPVHGDNIYNGADDDASGTSAVLELARVLGAGARPRRTVIFAFFGSEETGGQGSTYFSQHLPLPLRQIAADLEFEMIGRPDPALPDDDLWLSGWERSTLGPALVAHGAHLVGDPHSRQNFFARSDNFVLAKKGVVAQTLSSYGLHSDYHQPSDDVAHIDFKHMNAAIGSILQPINWLVNSSFTPEWNKGGRP
jgi:aminopeptidase YwaD